jgi:hypothetical protein
MNNARVYGLIAAAFVTGTFLSSPELRAYAAAAITSADIMDGTIQSIDIGNGQIKIADIGSGAVTSSKIKDGTIAKSDLQAGLLDLKIQLVQRTQTTDFPVNTFVGVIAYCNEDEVAVGGGYRVSSNNGAVSGQVNVATLTNENGFNVEAFNEDDVKGGLTAIVNCAKIVPD